MRTLVVLLAILVSLTLPAQACVHHFVVFPTSWMWGGLILSCLTASVAAYNWSPARYVWFSLSLPLILNGGSAGVAGLVWGLAYAPALLIIMVSAARLRAWAPLVLALPALGLLHALGETPVFFMESCTECPTRLKNLASALESYAHDHQGHFPPSLDSLSPKYLQAVPQCIVGHPSTLGTRLYRLQGIEFNPYNYSLSADAKRFQITCQTGLHGWSSSPKGRPAYDSVAGLLRSEPLPDLNEPPVDRPEGPLLQSGPRP